MSNIVIILLFGYYSFGGGTHTNAQIVAHEIHKTWSSQLLSGCFELKMAPSEKASILSELAKVEPFPISDTCSTKTILEIEISCRANWFKKNKVKRIISLRGSVSEVVQGKMTSVYHKETILTDTLAFSALGDASGVGALGFVRVEDRRLIRTLIEPTLVWSAVFMSVYLLFTIR